MRCEVWCVRCGVWCVRCGVCEVWCVVCDVLLNQINNLKRNILQRVCRFRRQGREQHVQLSTRKVRMVDCASYSLLRQIPLELPEASHGSHMSHATALPSARSPHTWRKSATRRCSFEMPALSSDLQCFHSGVWDCLI